MPSGRLMKHLFLPLLGFGVIAAATAASAQTAPPAFVSAIGDNTNIVFVENHIVIDRPANEIFDFVSTPGNVYKWFTKSSDAKPFITGALDHPNRVGDQVFENIDFPDGRKLSLVKTTVVCIPGFEWVVTGQPIGSDGKPLPQVLSLAVWTVQSLPGGNSMFSRFFSLVGSEGSVTVRARRMAPWTRWGASRPRWNGSRDTLRGCRRRKLSNGIFRLGAIAICRWDCCHS